MVGRSGSKTKSGKAMNPTDQARKEARRRELRRNKKQRMIARQSVLKNKSPETIMRELQALDEMEFDPLNPPPYNIKVLQDKRRKLKETWERVKKLYAEENPEKVDEMKRMEKEYENRRIELCAYYESVQEARRVRLDEIPLPEGEAPENPFPNRAPWEFGSKGTIIDTMAFTQPNVRHPPGPPPGPPPPLTDDEEYTADEPKKKSRFSDEVFIPPLPPNPPFIPPPPPPIPIVQNIVHSIPTPIAATPQSTTAAAVIQAKPQIKQRLQQITQMVPTVVKLKKNFGRQPTDNSAQNKKSNIQSGSQQKPDEPSTDDAYEQFMKEIDKLI